MELDKIRLHQPNTYDTGYQGLGGNFILNIPELDVVIVTTANGTIFDRGNEEEETMNFIAQEIIPAINKDVDSQTTSSIISLEFIGILSFLFLYIVLQKKKRNPRRFNNKL